MNNLRLDKLPQGFPFIRDYKELLKSNLFLEMETFSNAFGRNHIKDLSGYSWTPDSLHQWSRMWEYPFSYSYIRQFLCVNNIMNVSQRTSILDAGSGCTFFPYYVNYKYPNSVIYCCDYDSSLALIFKRINKKRSTNITFACYDIANMQYKDNSFDVIYCISVLEHTHDYDRIIEEFKRVLKPKGLLIITFDISLDGNAPISEDIAKDLLEKLGKLFKPENQRSSPQVLTELHSSDILTTQFIKTFNKKLLPWKLTWRLFLSQLSNLRSPSVPFHNLTIFCGVWREIL